MEEFVLYHINGDGECNNVVLKSWADRHNLSLQERYEISFLFSVTYCVQSAIILFEKLARGKMMDKESMTRIKPVILFQSDRKYMRMKDNFERCMLDFQKNNRDAAKFLNETTEQTKIILDKAIKKVEGWVMFGRFAAFLFLETFVNLTRIKIVNTSIDWRHGDTATSGLLNLFAYDKEAETFDKTGKLLFSRETMDRLLSITQKNIAKKGGEVNVTEIETSLCAYRKFYKGSRYNGYYLDRMLGEILFYQPLYPEMSAELISIRKEKFGKEYLGEIGGWNGIRRELKKYYLTTGAVN